MKTASVTELKARLSHYLRMARRGSEVQILDRGVPIARLVGIKGDRGGDEARLQELAKAGIIRQGTGGLEWLLEDPLVEAPGLDLGSALAEDREDRH
ncbi:MAG: type II toxin-antitoxin system prevent-host-death family antitoxin [Polyangia bacterium]|jgi:prevent-host-death family protein|nr:type II toxin-antitoxin system prevent-host-death family antitoxin [Polyangia bacterium]